MVCSPDQMCLLRIRFFLIIMGQEAVVYHTGPHHQNPPLQPLNSQRQLWAEPHSHNVGFTGGFIQKYFRQPWLSVMLLGHCTGQWSVPQRPQRLKKLKLLFKNICNNIFFSLLLCSLRTCSVFHFHTMCRWSILKYLTCVHHSLAFCCPRK